LATVALIQDLFKALNTDRPEIIGGFAKQMHDRFYEVLQDESGHLIQRADSLDNYQSQGLPAPDVVICAPFPEEDNLAPGIAELGRLRDFFGETPLIVWSTREEESIRNTAINDFGVAAYYTGTLLDAPEDLADLILEHAR
jgi:hypothetical protein